MHTQPVPSSPPVPGVPPGGLTGAADTEPTALDRVIAAAPEFGGAKAGTQKALALALGIKPPAIAEWARRRIPAERCLEIERLTGVSRYDQRPDVYGPAPEGQAHGSPGQAA